MVRIILNLYNINLTLLSRSAEENRLRYLIESGIYSDCIEHELYINILPIFFHTFR